MKRTVLCVVCLLFAASALGQSWTDQLRTFRDAVYQRDKEKAKQFFDFPVTAPGDVWNAATWNATGETNKHLQNLARKGSPLTAELFSLYFDQIFDKQFISCFLKIQTKDLKAANHTRTPDLSDDKSHFYYMDAVYDPQENTLTLTVAGHSTVEGEDGGEWARIYKFNIIDGQLKFDSVMVAG